MIGQGVPPFVPEPKAPRDRFFEAIEESRKSFYEGDMKMGVASLNHALWIAFTAQPKLNEREARYVYQLIEDAAKVWEPDA